MKYFSQILKAGKQRDISLLPEKGTFCIDEFKQNYYRLTAAGQLAQEGDFQGAEFLMRHGGAKITYVAQGAALGGHKEYAESLLTRGAANILYVALGAALGGHQEYAESLLTRGAANIIYVALGAALGGHQEYAESLLARGASINDLARGAALGGQQEYAETLLARGANIDVVAWGAAFAGHQEYTEALLARGASMNDVVLGAARGGHLDSEPLRLRYLSGFSNDKDREFFCWSVNKFSRNRFIIHPNVLTTANRIANFQENHDGFLHRTAEVISASKTNAGKSQWGALVFFAAVFLPHNNTPAIERVRITENREELPPLSSLPSELWCQIFEYVFASKFRGEDIERIGFATQKIMLMGVLNDYRDSLWTYFQRSKIKTTNTLLSEVNKAKDAQSLTCALHPNETDSTIARNQGLSKIVQSWRERFPATTPASDDDSTSESDAVEGVEASENNNATSSPT